MALVQQPSFKTRGWARHWAPGNSYRSREYVFIRGPSRQCFGATNPSPRPAFLVLTFNAVFHCAPSTLDAPTQPLAPLPEPYVPPAVSLSEHDSLAPAQLYPLAQPARRLLSALPPGTLCSVGLPPRTLDPMLKAAMKKVVVANAYMLGSGHGWGHVLNDAQQGVSLDMRMRRSQRFRLEGCAAIHDCSWNREPSTPGYLGIALHPPPNHTSTQQDDFVGYISNPKYSRGKPRGQATCEIAPLRALRLKPPASGKAGGKRGAGGEGTGGDGGDGEDGEGRLPGVAELPGKYKQMQARYVLALMVFSTFASESSLTRTGFFKLLCLWGRFYSSVLYFGK